MKISFPVAIVAACALTGCGVTVHNLTPSTVVRNASGIYPVEAEVKTDCNAILTSTMRAELVVWDQAAQMERVPTPPDAPARFAFSLAVPPEHTEVYYHFRVHYDIGKPFNELEPHSTVSPRGAPARAYMLRILDRISTGMDSERGRVGSTIAVLGKGFTPTDQVSIGGQVVKTVFKDATVLKFQIPSIAASQAYPIEVVGGAGDAIKVGKLLVDSADFAVTPIILVRGAKATLAIRIPDPAPPGGVTVTIATTGALADLPASVTIKEGKTEGLIKTIGHAAGSGQLMLESTGFKIVTIPYSVVENQ